MTEEEKELQALREHIEGRLSWTPYEDVERHRVEAVEAGVVVAAELLWLHAEAVWRLSRFEEPMAAIVDYGVNRIDEMLETVGLSDVSDATSAVERVTETLKAAAGWRSSRQAWAEEAMRLDLRTDPPLATEDEVGDIVYEFGNLNTTLTESVTEKLFEFFDIRPKPLRRQSEPLAKRVCACPPADAVFPAPWTPPQCAVHPAGSVHPEGEAQ